MDLWLGAVHQLKMPTIGSDLFKGFNGFETHSNKDAVRKLGSHSDKITKSSTSHSQIRLSRYNHPSGPSCSHQCEI